MSAITINGRTWRYVPGIDSAIEVAFNHGAHEWVRLNYPQHFERLAAIRGREA
jgi:hypothetical protein